MISSNTNSVIRYNGTTGALIGTFIQDNGLQSGQGTCMLFRSDGYLYISLYSGGAGSAGKILRFDATTGDFVDRFLAVNADGRIPAFVLFPAGAFSFSAAENFVAANADAATIQIDRNDGSQGEVTVQFTTTDGTAIAGVNYTDSTQVITFADGQTSQTVTIPILHNSASESEGKTINLALSEPTDDATLGSISQSVLTITNNGGGCQLGQESLPSSSLFLLIAPLLLSAFAYRKFK